MIMVQHPAGAQDQRVLFICLLGRIPSLDPVEFTQPSCEFAHVQDRRAWMIGALFAGLAALDVYCLFKFIIPFLAR